MRERLPIFRYHPDPIATGSVSFGDTGCHACRRSRGAIYNELVDAENQDDVRICPWCIADGSAAEIGVEFTSISAGDGEGIHAEVLETISARTPGFTGWQQERWLFHCGDGAAFLGSVGAEALKKHPDAVAAIEHECSKSGWLPTEARSYVDSLGTGSSPTAYLFRCLECGTYLAYSDFS